MPDLHLIFWIRSVTGPYESGLLSLLLQSVFIQPRGFQTVRRTSPGGHWIVEGGLWRERHEAEDTASEDTKRIEA